MLSTTGWALRMWAKITFGLLAVLAVMWLVTGFGAMFWCTAVFAVLLEWWLVRQLAREWAWQARGSWWWAP